MERPSNLKKSSKPQKKLKVKFKTDLSNSSLLLQDSIDQDFYEYLKTPDEKLLFLTKVGLIFIIYSFIFALTSLYIITYPDESNTNYLHKRLHVTIYIYLFVSLALKMIFSFFGYFIRSFAKFIFVIDLYLSYVIVLGLYYYLNDDIKNNFVSYGNYVLVCSFVFFANSIAFFLSTLFVHERKVFNYYLGLILMTISTLGSLFAFKIYRPIMTMGDSKYYALFFFITVINVYVCLNAYFVVNFRTKKFYKYEYIYCFMCFWADWFSVFWIDIVGGKKNAEEDVSVEVSTEKESDDEKDYKIDPEVASEKHDIENRS